MTESHPENHHDRLDEATRRAVAKDFARLMWGQESGEESPKIALDLTSPIADQLRLKQAEYTARSEKYQTLPLASRYADVRIKQQVLGKLLETGKLDWFDALEDVTTSGVTEDRLVKQGILRACIDDHTREASADDVVVVLPEDIADTTQRFAYNAFLVIQAYAEGRVHEVQATTGLPSVPEL